MTEEGAKRRWAILAVLCLSLVLVSLSNTSLNLALPTLGRDLHANPSDLQWVVNAYSLAFAALLITAGAVGDRVGPSRALRAGLIVFTAASAAASLSHWVGGIVAARATMGVGAALVMPATLSILTRVFPDDERRRAIAIWAGLAGVGGATGSLLTGWLLERWWWGAVFLVNAGAALVALGAGAALIPRVGPVTGPTPRPDLVAPVLSSLGMAVLVYSAIAAPRAGWASLRTVLTFGTGVAFMGAFAVWELSISRPMFEMRDFKRMIFTAAAATITLIFFTMYATVFLLSQYLQLVNRYTPMQAGMRLLPLPLSFLVAAPMSARAVRRWGHRRVVCSGLGLLAAGALILSRVSVRPNELLIAGALMIMATGMGMTTAPSTSAIMDALPPERAGAGSAINDTTRELGGALGVAVVGSIVTTLFAARTGKVSGPLSSGLSIAGARAAYVHALALAFGGLALLVALAASAGVFLGRMEKETRAITGANRMDETVQVTVETLLGFAGINPAEHEVMVLKKWYPTLRHALDTLHAVDGARYVSPALVFGPKPTFADWHRRVPGEVAVLEGATDGSEPA